MKYKWDELVERKSERRMKVRFLRLKKKNGYQFYQIPSSSQISSWTRLFNHLLKNRKIPTSWKPVSQEYVQSVLTNKNPMAYGHLEPCIFFNEMVGHHYFAIGMDQWGKHQYKYLS